MTGPFCALHGVTARLFDRTSPGVEHLDRLSQPQDVAILAGILLVAAGLIAVAFTVTHHQLQSMAPSAPSQ